MRVSLPLHDFTVPGAAEMFKRTGAFGAQVK